MEIQLQASPEKGPHVAPRPCADDAIIGVGLPASIALDFSREAPTAKDAVNSAIKAVTDAIPGVKLSGVSADFQIIPY
jgi:hypothetical protein